MTKNTRNSFDPEFRLEAAKLVVEQKYSIRQPAQATNVGKSTMDKWVRQLKQERQGKSPVGYAMTPDQRRIKELERQLKWVELENHILKKATALLMSDSLNDFR